MHDVIHKKAKMQYGSLLKSKGNTKKTQELSKYKTKPSKLLKIINALPTYYNSSEFRDHIYKYLNVCTISYYVVCYNRINRLCCITCLSLVIQENVQLK